LLRATVGRSGLAERPRRVTFHLGLLTTPCTLRLRQRRCRHTRQDQQPDCQDNPVPQLPHDVTPIPIPFAAFSVAERRYLKFFGRGAKVFTKVMENKDTKN